MRRKLRGSLFPMSALGQKRTSEHVQSIPLTPESGHLLNTLMLVCLLRRGLRLQLTLALGLAVLLGLGGDGIVGEAAAGTRYLRRM